MWEYDTGDGGKHDLFMDSGESIRFRITGETFTETCPAGPSGIQESQESTENKVPYSLTVSSNILFKENVSLLYNFLGQY